MAADALEPHPQPANAREEINKPEGAPGLCRRKPDAALADRLVQRADRKAAGCAFAFFVPVDRPFRDLEELTDFLQGQSGLLAEPAELGSGRAAEGRDSVLGHLLPPWQLMTRTPRPMFLLCSRNRQFPTDHARPLINAFGVRICSRSFPEGHQTMKRRFCPSGMEQVSSTEGRGQSLSGSIPTLF